MQIGLNHFIVYILSLKSDYQFNSALYNLYIIEIQFVFKVQRNDHVCSIKLVTLYAPLIINPETCRGVAKDLVIFVD